jgi:hypothetical protein
MIKAGAVAAIGLPALHNRVALRAGGANPAGPDRVAVRPAE